MLSVRGREHAPDAYAGYWTDPRGFRGQQASDRRLATKTPVFAFERDGVRYSTPHERAEGGRTLRLADETRIFVYREAGAAQFESTRAFVSRAGFARDGADWVELETGAVFDAERSRFRGGRVRTLNGFDTFWYNWSLNNPDAVLLE